MTSEELILLLDSLQTQLPKCANQVLLRLVSKCVTAGTNEVEISGHDLATELNISRDAVTVAARALAGIITVRGGERISTTWVLPGDWFVVQRELFAVVSPVEKSSSWQSNQARLAWKPGQQLDEKPGQTGLETRPAGRVTRPAWTTYQASTGLETRPAPTENQSDDSKTGLETRPRSIDRDRGLSSVERVLLLRDSIEGVNWLPEELRQDGDQLKRWLRFYFAQTRPQHPVPDGPDEIIQAKCLALANLARLQHVLAQLHKKSTRPGDNWAWFVTVFCQRIKGTKDTSTVPAPPAFRQTKKTPSSERRPEFVDELLSEVSGATGRMQ
ncbi:MAG TPA: hypothetical protein VKT75_05765 [Acidobacteriaceae bacterium]|nr:hypothetical protein [Acidobacteriaceae bacterium]